jgi:hypothetical protein
MAYPKARSYCFKHPIADINAGIVVVPPDVTRTLTVSDFKMIARGGAAGAVTSIDIVDTAGAPVTVGTVLQAALTQDSVVRAGAANTTVPKLGEPATPGSGLKVQKNGAAITGATHIVIDIEYTVG